MQYCDKTKNNNEGNYTQNLFKNMMLKTIIQELNTWLIDYNVIVELKVL